MAEADWETVTYLRKKAPTKSDAKSKQAIAAAQRKGEAVETNKKFSAATNRQHTSSSDTAVLDRETEELHHSRISLSVGQTIQRARQDKKWNQKELATKINEKPQVINEYESGRAIPNNQIMGKLERALGVKLRGKDIGKPLSQGPKKK